MPLGVYERTEKHRGKNAPNYKNGKYLKKYHCIDCGKELSDWRATKCHSCSQKGKNNSFYKNGKFSQKNYCVNCGKEISYTATRCMSCDTKKKWQNPKLRKKMTKARSTPEHKEKDREAMKKYWREGIFDGAFQSPTKPEKEIMQILKDLKISYTFNLDQRDILNLTIFIFLL